MSSFGSDTPFMLLAKLKVKEDKVAEYLEIADKTDKAVEADEPGMLHHTFDQDPDDPLRFVWSEVYKNDDALLAHLANPLLGFILRRMQNWELICLLNFTELLEIKLLKL